MSAQLLESKLPEILTHYPYVDLVYLFGSQATGSVGPMSDSDLGVLVDREEMEHSPDTDQIRARFAHDLATALCTDRIDVVLLNDAPIELQYAVIAQGKRLHQRDVATRVEYEASVMSAYGDYLPVLRAQREDILRGDKRGTRVQRYRAALGRTRRALGQITSAQRDPGHRV
jgi:predicted nucleotidyltransferase